MNQPDTQPTENTCIQPPLVRTLATEQLCQLLRDRRRNLKKERIALLAVADRLKDEIATYDKLLEGLTTR